ncbi:MAG: SpoVA/SpoVAEb family sporulation membrane protein [Oscillospiraceae bacterium]|jgi:stage V sporulation protein AC|nr:SpoVA/SpoVAEb family sporulation membrane protein [Oscillospiraceae bacterium]
MIFLSVSKEEYKDIVEKASPGAKWAKNSCFAFLFGGIICMLGQVLFIVYSTRLGMKEEEARVLVSVSLVGLGAFLTAIKVFDNIAKIAGAGTLVPITGFANSIVAPAIEFKSEGYILGMGAKMFVIAGPVLVFGIISSVIYGLIVWFLHLY